MRRRRSLGRIEHGLRTLGIGCIWLTLTAFATAAAKDQGGGGSWTDSVTAPWSQLKMPDLDLRMPSLPRPKLAMPSLPSPKEPAFVASTRKGMGRAWTSTKRTTRNAWQTTKSWLRPYDSPQRRRSSASSRADRDSGFWSGLFGSQEETPPTVNDFLKQPMPF